MAIALFRGSQVVKERKVLEVHITKGMRNGQKIVFHGEADEAPGVVPGDIIFIVEEKVESTKLPCHFALQHRIQSIVHKRCGEHPIFPLCLFALQTQRSGSVRRKDFSIYFYFASELVRMPS